MVAVGVMVGVTVGKGVAVRVDVIVKVGIGVFVDTGSSVGEGVNSIGKIVGGNDPTLAGPVQLVMIRSAHAKSGTSHEKSVKALPLVINILRRHGPVRLQAAQYAPKSPFAEWLKSIGYCTTVEILVAKCAGEANNSLRSSVLK